MNSLSFTVSDGVATLAIQRSAVSNAIDITIIRAMHLALDQIQKGEGGAKAVSSPAATMSSAAASICIRSI